MIAGQTRTDGAFVPTAGEPHRWCRSTHAALAAVGGVVLLELVAVWSWRGLVWAVGLMVLGVALHRLVFGTLAPNVTPPPTAIQIATRFGGRMLTDQSLRACPQRVARRWVARVAFVFDVAALFAGLALALSIGVLLLAGEMPSDGTGVNSDVPALLRAVAIGVGYCLVHRLGSYVPRRAER